MWRTVCRMPTRGEGNGGAGYVLMMTPPHGEGDRGRGYAPTFLFVFWNGGFWCCHQNPFPNDALLIPIWCVWAEVGVSKRIIGDSDRIFPECITQSFQRTEIEVLAIKLQMYHFLYVLSHFLPFLDSLQKYNFITYIEYLLITFLTASLSVVVSVEKKMK